MPDREYGFSNEVARTFTNLAAISAVVDPEIRTMRWTITVQYDLPPIVYFLPGNYPSLVLTVSPSARIDAKFWDLLAHMLPDEIGQNPMGKPNMEYFLPAFGEIYSSRFCHAIPNTEFFNSHSAAKTLKAAKKAEALSPESALHNVFSVCPSFARTKHAPKPQKTHYLRTPSQSQPQKSKALGLIRDTHNKKLYDTIHHTLSSLFLSSSLVIWHQFPLKIFQKIKPSPINCDSSATKSWRDSPPGAPSKRVNDQSPQPACISLFTFYPAYTQTIPSYPAKLSKPQPNHPSSPLSSTRPGMRKTKNDPKVVQSDQKNRHPVVIFLLFFPQAGEFADNRTVTKTV